MLAVLDPNVLVSAAISTAGPPRVIVDARGDGRFELLASPALIDELADVLARPRFRSWISTATAAEFIAGPAGVGGHHRRPARAGGADTRSRRRLPDRLARAGGAHYLVSGDRHLTELPDPDLPVLTPRQFLALLHEG